ncbi:MAG: hypothetical protein WA133_12760, partial [Syntrophales bacterium]
LGGGFGKSKHSICKDCLLAIVCNGFILCKELVRRFVMLGHGEARLKRMIGTPARIKRKLLIYDKLESNLFPNQRKIKIIW